MAHSFRIENNKVSDLIHDFDKMSEKKTQKRENMFINFVMKATARDQENRTIISVLNSEIANLRGELILAEMERDVQTKMIQDMKDEVDRLKKEIETKEELAVKELKRASLSGGSIPSMEKPAKKTDRFRDFVISTQCNIVAAPLVEDPNQVSSSKVDPLLEKPKIVNRRSLKRTKEMQVSSFLYNLRSRVNKSKTHAAEKI